MSTQYMGVMGVNMLSRDVGKPHAANLNKDLCLSLLGQAIVPKGRTQAADTSHWGRVAEQPVPPSPRKTRSRGCPRAQKQFWHSAHLPSWQPARQKSLRQFTLKKLFRKSRFILASTSNIWGRAQGAFCAMPALLLSARPAASTGWVGGAA